MNRKSIITLACVIVAILVLIFAVVSLINNGDNSETPKNETTQSSEDIDVVASNDETTKDEPQKDDEVSSSEKSTSVPTDEKSTDKPQTDKRPNSTTSADKPATEKPDEDTTNDGPQTDLPPVVPVVPDNDEDNDEDGVLTFPCKVEGYGLTIEKLAPYNGTFVEDGTNASVDEVAMLLIKNNGDFPVEYAQINVQYEQESLLFDLTALPVGDRVVVQEKNGKKVPSGDALSATAMVLQEAELSLSEGSVSVVDNGNNTLTVKNLTDKMIPTIRVFYKYYMEEENIFVGGISFTVRLTRMGAGESVTIQPSHFTSNSSRVVMVLTYDSEV